MGRQRCEKTLILRAKISWWLIKSDMAVEIVGRLQTDRFQITFSS